MERWYRITIITITAVILVVSGMATVPALDNQAHVILFNDSSNKVKSFVNNVLGKIFHRDGGNLGGGGCLTCG